MIVDPKLQQMFDRCHERKQQIDRNKRLARGAMFLPPFAVTVLTLVNYVMRVFSGAALVLLGGEQDHSGFMLGPIMFIFAAALTIFTACDAMLDIPAAAKHDLPVLISAGTAGLLISLFVSFERSEMAVGLSLFCFAAVPLALLLKKLRAQDDELKPLKGYPHFNILLMSEKELAEADSSEKSKKEVLNAMSDDERLMYERENNF